jgi:catechol 2,3-dioxygenase-like lactoylglutathione lyase family enzyme
MASTFEQRQEKAMQLRFGRLFDHLHLRSADLEASHRFYAAALGALGISIHRAVPGRMFQADELYVSPADADGPVSHVHLAFQTPDRATVDRFYVAALAAGCRDNGAPGERNYHPGYYACFVLDPDGNNVEAVYHGPGKRSAAAVVIEA